MAKKSTAGGKKRTPSKQPHPSSSRPPSSADTSYRSYGGPPTLPNGDPNTLTAIKYKKFEKLARQHFVGIRTLDMDALEDLGIQDEVTALVNNAGLNTLAFISLTGFKFLTCEFLASFSFTSSRYRPKIDDGTFF